MTFIHIYLDSMDPCEEEEGDGGRDGRGRRVAMFHFCPLAAFSMCSWLWNRYSLTQEGVGEEESSQGEQGKGIQGRKWKKQKKRKLN